MAIFLKGRQTEVLDVDGQAPGRFNHIADIESDPQGFYLYFGMGRKQNS